MKKIILWSVAGILILGICAGAIWWLLRPQVIQLDKNTKLTLLGVEYGKHHKFPKISGATSRRNFGGPNSFDTTNDTLVVWVLRETKGQERYGWQTLVYDMAETAAVQNWAMHAQSFGQNKSITGIQLNAFPRRDNKFIMRVLSYGNNGEHISKDQFIISNPARNKTFPNWTADALPNTQTDGDLSVTLNKLVFAQSPYNRGGNAPKNDPANQVVDFDLDVQQKDQSVTNWRPEKVELSDATGNYLTPWVNENHQNGQTAGWFFQQGLWPNESAWKVRLEMSRTSGFNDDELWSVANVPARASTRDAWTTWQIGDKTNTPYAETNVNGIDIKIFPALQYVSQFRGGQKVVGIFLQTDPPIQSAGIRLTPLAVTDDQGRKLDNRGAEWSDSEFQYEFGETRKVDSVNVTIALHKSRFFEFMVKPAKQ